MNRLRADHPPIHDGAGLVATQPPGSPAATRPAAARALATRSVPAAGRRLAARLAVAFAFAWALAPAPASAADDPSIQGATREGIQAAMVSFVEAQEAGDGTMLHYDPVTGELLRLKLVDLHEGIVKKGHFYVSCADFQDEAGDDVDIDFLVVPSGDGFRVNQAIVHKAGGKKRAYHVEQRWPGLF